MPSSSPSQIQKRKRRRRPSRTRKEDLNSERVAIKHHDGKPITHDLNNEKANTSEKFSLTSSVVRHAMQWFEKRKKTVPDALISASSKGGDLGMAQLLRMLPGLRERERRALLRYVEKHIKENEVRQWDGTTQTRKYVAEEELDKDSDGEYDIRCDNNGISGTQPQNQVENASRWPQNVEFSNDYRWDPRVPKDIKEKHSPPGKVRRRTPRFSKKVYFKRITDRDHPAYGEFGLFCALPDGAPPGTWLLDYVGHVTLGEDQNESSDYLSEFGPKGEFSCDADRYGNEARFINDFRNTGKYPNVEFNFRRDRNGELRQGVYVKLAKDCNKKQKKLQGQEEGEGTSRFTGVKMHEELLVSYGKAYWRRRVGNLTDFVWRLPGERMPEGGKAMKNS